MTRAQGRGRLSQTVMLVLLNLMFLPLALLVTAVFLVVGAPYVTLYSIAFRNRRRTMRLIRRTFSHWGRAILMCAWPFVRIRYVDLAPAEEPPFVFVANHRSASDGFLMAFLPFECIQVINIWPGRLPLIGPLAKLAGYLSVREMPFEEFLKAGSKLLGEGVSVIAFPEGTRSGSAQMGQFHSSAFRLAQHNNARIVPLAIMGNENIPRRGSAILRPGCIVLSKLPALTPKQYEGMTPYKLKTLVHGIIQKHLDDQSGQTQGITTA